MAQWSPLVPVVQYSIITHENQSALRHPILMSYQGRSHRSSFSAGVDRRRKVSIIWRRGSIIKAALWEGGNGLKTNPNVGGKWVLFSDQCAVFSFVRQRTDVWPVFRGSCGLPTTIMQHQQYCSIQVVYHLSGCSNQGSQAARASAGGAVDNIHLQPVHAGHPVSVRIHWADIQHISSPAFSHCWICIQKGRVCSNHPCPGHPRHAISCVFVKIYNSQSESLLSFTLKINGHDRMNGGGGEGNQRNSAVDIF